ncbi:MAG: hypothetical protein ACOYM2_16540, partial [Rectinemataceae bacterium]
MRAEAIELFRESDEDGQQDDGDAVVRDESIEEVHHELEDVLEPLEDVGVVEDVLELHALELETIPVCVIVFGQIGIGLGSE